MNFNDNNFTASLLKNGNKDGTNGAAMVERDVKLQVRFYSHAVVDEMETAKLGRRIYREVPYMEKRVIGDRDFLSAPVNLDVDPRQFAQEWAQYQHALAHPETFIRCLPGITPCLFAYCMDAEIGTIEQLAVSDVQPELVGAKAVAEKWVAMCKGETAAPKSKGGRPKGSKNVVKLKAVPHVENAEAAA